MATVKKKTRILVVDDEPMMCSLLDRILTRDGYEVVTAANADEALAHLRNERFGIMISDIKMPGMNGFELLKIVKADYPDTAVIMMTAYGDYFSVKDAMLLRADEYITKPFRSYDMSMLVDRVYWRLSGEETRGNPSLTQETAP
ncbi:MAG: response regulator [Candidatus Zixiibacteriota bacterium]|nr:MAG: response regulator [candidate division Zixibacteria bacterium]